MTLNAFQLRSVPADASSVGSGRDLSRLIRWLHSPGADIQVAEIPALIAQLASLQSELVARLLEAPASEKAETFYLTLKQLAQRTGIGQSTLRAMTSKVFEEGVHFIRNGRRLLFIWPAVEARIREWSGRARRQPADVVEPFIRRGRRRAS
jgi:hypothetical protein